MRTLGLFGIRFDGVALGIFTFCGHIRVPRVEIRLGVSTEWTLVGGLDVRGVVCKVWGEKGFGGQKPGYRWWWSEFRRASPFCFRSNVPWDAWTRFMARGGVWGAWNGSVCSYLCDFVDVKRKSCQYKRHGGAPTHDILAPRVSNDAHGSRACVDEVLRASVQRCSVRGVCSGPKMGCGDHFSTHFFQ